MLPSRDVTGGGVCAAIAYVDAGGKLVEAMQDVIYIEAENGCLQLINLAGEEKRLSGRLKHIDFWKEHSVVIEEV